MIKGAVYFDRDGILNELVKPKFERGPRNLSELIFVNGADATLNELGQMNIHCEVISNQPDFARSLLKRKQHLEIVSAVSQKFPHLKAQRYCLHDNLAGCLCRKPKPGLFFESSREFRIDLSSSFFVGDKWTDVLAAKAAGMKSILLRMKNSWDATSQGAPPIDLVPDFEIQELNHILGIVTNFYEKPSY